jgi:tRNA dimethylallyltransferase
MSDLLVIVGPTASGKTALGVAAALAFHGEVVSADSMQIYRGMDIGTAKPSLAERQGVPHHMFDVADPSENFSAAKYGQMAAQCVEDIRRRGKLPIVVGGTGLYIDSLLRGTEYAAAPGDSGLRQQLEAEYDALGGAAFREKLRAVDPERAALLPPGDKKRLVRAYEVYALTGKTITWHDQQSQLQKPRYTAVKVGLDFRRREDLYERIDRRAALMFERGLVEETQKLLEGDISMDSTAMQAIGYKQAAAYLQGRCTLAEAIEMVQRRSRQYAKRQLTWFRRDKATQWIFWEKEPDIGDVSQHSTEFFGL